MAPSTEDTPELPVSGWSAWIDDGLLTCFARVVNFVLAGDCRGRSPPEGVAMLSSN